MRKKIITSTFLILIFIVFVLTSFSCLNLKGKPEDFLQIEVKETELMVKNKPFKLRGVSIADPYFLDNEDNHFKEDMFIELSKWNINVVRVPIHPGCWQAEESFMEKYLDTVIEWARKYHFYIILDWHAIGNPLNGIAQGAPEWTIEGYKVYDSSFSLLENAWLKLSERYGKNPQIIFELFNEPVALGDMEISGEKWTETLEKLIDKIRVNAPETLILVSGWKWTFDLVDFAFHPVERKNIAYVAHVYSSHDEGWNESFGWVTNKHPLIITEWGFSPTVDKTAVYYGFRHKFGQKFYRYMENRGASWVAWCFHPTWLPNMIKNWDFGLTSEGMFVKQLLTKDKKSPTLSIDSHKNMEVVNGIVNVEGRAEDNIGILAIDARVDIKKYEDTESVFNETYNSATWSYTINTYKLSNGIHDFSVKVFDTAGNVKRRKIKLNIKNEEDKDIPVIRIETPEENEVLTGTNLIKVKIEDESSIEYLRACIDNIEHTCYDSIKVKYNTLYNGVFSSANLKNNEFTVNLDTTRLDNGQHTLNIKAEDIFGNTGKSDKYIFFSDNDKYLVSYSENIDDWDIYSGGGTYIEKELAEGIKGNCVKVHYTGCPTGWWGCRKVSYRDYSKFNGIEFYFKGTSNIIRLQIVDRDFKCWIYTLIPDENWKKMRILFSDLKYRGDWQKAGIPRNKDMKLDGMLEVSFIHTVKNQSAKGYLWIDEVKLF